MQTPALTAAEWAELNRLREQLAYRERVKAHWFVRLVVGYLVMMVVFGLFALSEVGGVAGLLLGPVAFVVFLMRPGLMLLRSRVKEAERLAEQKTQAAQARFAAQHRAWWEARAAYDAAERARVEREVHRYGVVRPEPSPRRVNIYGGTTFGWQALVTTLGASMLAGGRRVIVLDVSHREVPARLLAAALEAEVTVDETVLPRDQHRFQPLAGLRPEEAAVLLAEALHEADSGDRQGRNLDIRVLQRVCRVLAPGLSMARLAAALRVLLGEEGAPDQNGVLSGEEYDQLSTLMGSEYRTNARLFERMMLLEADIAQLEQIGVATARRPGTGALQFVSLSRRGGSMNDLYLELLVHQQIRRMREAEVEDDHPVLIIAGAGRLRERHLREFDQLTEETGAALVCLFERYGENERKSGPTGDTAVGFMTLNDAAEAAAAADQIGDVERFILSQRGTSHGSSTGETWSFGRSEGETAGSFSRGTSSEEGGSKGKTKDSNRTDSLQVRHLVEARDLRAGQHTDLYLVWWQRNRGSLGMARQDAGQRHVWYADCEPRIGLHPQASQHPFPELTA